MKPLKRLDTIAFWRFIHMLSHIPMGFGEPLWVTRFHDLTAAKWKSRLDAAREKGGK